LEPQWREWLNEDVTYIITDEERNAFLQLNTEEGCARFAEQFWLRRDPTPGTIENEYKDEHYRRIAYANEHFGTGNPGWKSDRGRIYITYGPADQVESHPYGGGSANLPIELWSYRHIEGLRPDFHIDFIDSTRTGEYRIAADQPDREMLSDPEVARRTLAAQMGLNTAAAPPGFTPVANPGVANVKFKDLEAALGTRTTGNALPMQVRVDCLRGFGAYAFAIITVQFESRDLQFQATDGVSKSLVNLLGRISTITGRPVHTFEEVLETPIETDAPPGPQTNPQRRSIYQHSFPLPAGPYRLNIVAKDTIADKLNSYAVALDVPGFDGDKLASSSLVLADVIERVPMMRPPNGPMFVIGNSKVRPRLGNSFTTAEKVGVYLQVYNFKPDENTQKPSGWIEYEVDRSGSNEKIADSWQDIGSIANASASQVTIEKLLPLRTFSPGTYTIKVTVTDRNGNQTLQRQGNFTVSLQ
jgi:GWxTD domain-containing protein